MKWPAWNIICINSISITKDDKQQNIYKLIAMFNLLMVINIAWKNTLINEEMEHLR